jgi:pimeloyl-ACP methyl ester carboxylesterase
MGGADGDVIVHIEGVSAQPTGEGERLEVSVETNHGPISALMDPCQGGTKCAIFVGLQGPAGGVYARLAADLVEAGVTSLRIEPRVSGELEDTVIDVLAACSLLKGLGGERAVIVGHSYAGAVAIKSGVLSPFATAVAALAPQRYGTQEVDRLGKPLLLIHGSDDTVLLPLASDDIYQRAQEPKKMVILEATGHRLLGVEDEVYTLLRDFIASVP